MMIEKPILRVLQELQQHGETYIVGGYLRDTLLGIKPKDVDLTTNIPFARLKELLPSLYATEQGEKMGIGRFQKNGLSFEISTFSNSIEKDMRKKDFTINAMYHDGKTLFNHDYASVDLKNRFIRPHDDFLTHCETHPQAYLRAIRIASRINGDLDLSLLFLMKENRHIFHQNNENRIRQEGYEILHGQHPQKAFAILTHLGFIPAPQNLPETPLHFDPQDVPFILAYLSEFAGIETVEAFVRLFGLKEQHLTDMRDILSLSLNEVDTNHPKRMQQTIKWFRYRYQADPEKLQTFFEELKTKFSPRA